MLNSTKYILTHFFYYTIFFPFVSIFPIGTDLQPIFIIIMILLIVLKYITFLQKDKYLIIIALASLIYFNPFSYDLIPFKGFGAYLSVFISLFFLLVYSKTFNKDIFITVLKRSIIIYFISSLIFNFFPDYFSAFQLNFVRAVNSIDSGISFRGISTYFTEPGLFGAHMVGLMVLIIGLFNNKLIKARVTITYVLMLTIMIILSKSGMGYLYLLFILFYFMYINKTKVKIIIPLILSLSYLTTFNFEYLLDLNRGISALFSFSDLSTLTDTSILKRVYDFILGFYILIEHPFGMGFNFDVSNVIEIIKSSSFLGNFYNINKKIGFVSSLSLFFAYYGIFTVLVLIYIIKKYKPTFLNAFFALAFLSFSFSGAYPLIWVLLVQEFVLIQNLYIKKNKLL